MLVLKLPCPLPKQNWDNHLEQKKPAIHATAISIDGAGILITGPSGSGKSDLALRLIDRGAVLISDDYVIVNSGEPYPRLHQPPHIAGKIEVRAVGIFDLEATDNIPVRLCVQLGAEGERLPDTIPLTEIAGQKLPTIYLDGFNASAPIKVELALHRVLSSNYDDII